MVKNKNQQLEIEGNSWYYSRVQNLIWLDNNLDIYAKATYCNLCKFADVNTNKAFPSYNTIAKEVSCSRKKVRESIKKLAEAGYLTKKNRKNKKNEYISNLYQIKRIAYIFDAITTAKEENCEVLEKKILEKINNHPIPTKKEIYKIIANSNINLENQKEKTNKKELENLYESGYR